ncbi:MAG TPA: glycosyltransferase [Candidatus Paceibacterota bacterium]|nr:glycosyltransferase [Candidatus Paceibacterota bacterium]
MNSLPKKKVLFLITKSNWGGAQRYVYDLATNLDKNLFEPVVALGGKGELVSRLNDAGIRVIVIDSLQRDISIKQEWQFIKELASIIKTEKPDILHVNSSKAGGIGTLLGRLLFVPRVIFTAHGWAFNEDRPKWQKIIIKFLHWITILLSHRTIAVSSAILKQLNWPGVERKTKVLHPGRNIGVMYETDEARIKIQELIPDKSLLETKNLIWLGTIGELHPIKRQDLLIESLALIHEEYPLLRLFILGEGSERIRLEKLIVDRGLTDKVFLPGNVSEAARLLKAFCIFLLSSKSEAYGYVLHEAGLAGLPVIATNVGGIPEIIEHNVSGLLVSPDDVQKFKAALIQMIENQDQQQILATNLKEKMVARSLEKMIRATEALYTL